jgi:hypothetical protein
VSKGFEISGSWLAHNPFSLRIKFDIVDFGEKDVNLMGLLFDLFQWSSCNNGHDAFGPKVIIGRRKGNNRASHQAS